MRNKRSVWTITTKPFKEAHFATFPEDLILPCILAGCPMGGTVLDPFAGAGTTGVVAKENNRHFIGIELNPEYVEMAQKRIDNVVSNSLVEQDLHKTEGGINITFVDAAKERDEMSRYTGKGMVDFLKMGGGNE